MTKAMLEILAQLHGSHGLHSGLTVFLLYNTITVVLTVTVVLEVTVVLNCCS